ncbi:hypothetical protein RND81_01G050000 [Saponaria officinalis]|uniref:Bifunctional inhibitor/plant lipid transfer protein/seed storage helical domain-containing protein n=1 Tax=Saponaria officinalis TaxID=3572 RepID=A0AAW1NC50_SAPOF
MLKSHKIFLWALIICAAMSVKQVKGQSPMMSPTGAPDCMTMIYNMSDCLTYVEKGSKVLKPDKACCPELAGMLDSNPICLCQLLGNSNTTKSLGIQFDVSKALKLPSICGLQTPPISLCAVAGIPIAAPTSSEGPSSSVSGTPAGAPTSSLGVSPSGGMSPEAAENSPGKNGASNVHFSLLYLVAVLAVESSIF